MDMRETILKELKTIEERLGVRVLHAVEAGSRAWGFASPDSDYDVRFVYMHPAEDYLRLDEPRDVIQWRLDEVLDINGWDLRKALRQFARGNAALYEWRDSPIVYQTTEEWACVREASAAYFSEKAALHHYYGTAMNTWAEHLRGESLRYKKYFYALRPLLAAQYIERLHSVPPVLFEQLLETDLSPALRAAIDELLERKKLRPEGEYSPHLPAIRDFIREELPRQKALIQPLPDDRNTDHSALDRCFARLLGLGPCFSETAD